MMKKGNIFLTSEIRSLKENLYKLRMSTGVEWNDKIDRLPYSEDEKQSLKKLLSSESLSIPLSQKELGIELARCVGRETPFTRKTISNAENIAVNFVPSEDLISAYCRYFNISRNALFDSEDIVRCCLDHQAVSNYVGLSCDAVKVLHYHARHDNRLTSKQVESGEQYYYKNDVIEIFDWLLTNRDTLRALVSFKRRLEELNGRKNGGGMAPSDYSALKRGAVADLSDTLVTAFQNYNPADFVTSRELSKDEYDRLQAIKKNVLARASSVGECKEDGKPLTRDEVANVFIGDESIKNAIIDEVMQEQAVRGRGRAVSSERLTLYDEYRNLIDLLNVEYLSEEKNLIALCYCSEDSKEYKNAFARLEDLRKQWNDKLIV